ncbi:hypothetical protein Tco_1540557 [Tanacetum coccineum]
MGEQHLSTIPGYGSEKIYKSSVENLVQIPKVSSEDFSAMVNIDYLLEEFSAKLTHINLFPPGINFDPEEEIRLIEELFDFLSFLVTKSFHFDHYDVPSSPRPLAKPPDDGIFFQFKPDTGVLTTKVVEDISEHYVLMPKLLLTQPTLCPDIDTLLPFSSENEDTVFNPGILSSPLLSHRGKIISNFSKSPMMISGGNIPLYGCPGSPNFPHGPLNSGSSQARDSVNKNKRFVGGNPCLSLVVY